MSPRRRRPPTLRRWSQGVLLAGFLALFLRTAYRGSDLLDWPVHLALRLDPLAASAELLATGREALVWAWSGAALLLVASALLGRFFCGWMCPLGTVLDLAGALRRRRAPGARSLPSPPPGLAVSVLLALLVAAALGLPLLGLFDPLSLLLRSLALAVHPVFDHAAKALLGALGRAHVPVLSPAADALYDSVKTWLLAFGRPVFLLSGLTLALFAGVLALEAWAPRFWCTHLCPLGALLGLAARLSPWRRRRAADCGPCTACRAVCPTGAASGEPSDDGADPGLCLQCGACEGACAQGGRRPTPGWGRPSEAFLPGRRALLTSVAVGAAGAAVAAVRGEEIERPWDLIRPPGARPEPELAKRCIRCGACMRVCPRNGLHPALLEAGLGGLWTPRFDFRLGYCEYHCRLCGQVCPTGAIRYLAEGEKEKTVFGTALFDPGRCLPYRKGQNCMVCEEHCPTSPKAIVFHEEEVRVPDGTRRRVKIPKVVEERCVGCGVCENKCPLPGRAAIRVARERPGALQDYY